MSGWKPGTRPVFSEFCLYHNCTEEALPDVMTDSDGHRYCFTLPIGKMRDEVWAKQKAIGHELLCPPFLEVLDQISQPFITAVSETMAS